MPGLQAFGRLWIVASDDFVFPAALELVINYSWLLAVTTIYLTHDPGGTCAQRGTLATYILGCGFQLLVSVPLLVSLIVCSGRGAVMETAARRAVPSLLYCRLALFLFSVGWDVAGSVWLSSDIRHCVVTSPTVQVIIALVICNWLRSVVILIGLAVVFDPLGSVSLSGAGYSSARRKKSLLRRSLWHARFRFLCCCLHTDETSEALRDVAGHIATLVGEVDLVPSDVVAGLILLQQKHANQPEGPPEPPAHLQHRPATHARSDWMTVPRAAHFMRYALGVYGWPWFVHGRLTSSLRLLWRRIICCAHYRGKPSLALGDNCCLCNTAALQECTALEDGDFLYVSFVNRLYQVAFLVAVDHAAESIVVAVRGTLSVIDALTDLCLDSAVVEETGRPQDRAHKGMLQAARYIETTLRETEALDRAVTMHPDYTVVVTGHSLGAGAAALLARMLLPTHPRLQCFAFSPPGGLVSRPLSEDMQAYVMSVVCGDDLVPRLSVAAVEKLKNELEDALNACTLSKHSLLYRACCNCACGASHDLVTPEDGRDSETDVHRPLVDSVDRSNYESLVDVAERAMLADARAEHVPLYLPGHVLHVTTATEAHGRDGAAGAPHSEWRTPEYFCNIRVTGNMFSDHLPDLVNESLRRLAAEHPC
ncbi:diacylglycerol lipase-beta-like [Amphibalanus amphitrite]|uniref:diacylglycerol lipase-beta-like n=1 Tax=Amphibalanus amphitrite TaxID=1232801 RepID=UPI001C9235F1|nr:diacylglycerol lipase-beta-like [Amphibalanus amphitrite]XP_043242315.1 diacylglycerol lipase-beta-like [Amphibalanus amphitrite]XP_043242324.1 diacylglycerol lipase-beta-like [Amphibalanus amphitrite]XP_043242333.1 diacylglycerol lipase-beta-like [Amphibalanus amphitrite]